MSKIEAQLEVESATEKLGGQWIFTGTRVPVSALFENLRDGASIDEFLEWFPGVERRQVESLLAQKRTIDIYELIERIRPRPAMYLGLASLTRLNSFLDGYRSALDDLRVELAGTPAFGYFHDWVAMKLGKYEGTAGYCHLILESTQGDEKKALDRFFTYLDEFKRRKATVHLEGVPFAGSSWWVEVDSTTGEQKPLEKPVLVQIVKYTDDKGVFVRYLGADGNPVHREGYHQDLDDAFWWTRSLVDKDAWKVPEDLLGSR